MYKEKNNKLEFAIEAADNSGRFFCKFISANDVGLTKAHQEGIYLAKSAWDIFYPGIEKSRDKNIEKVVKIHIDPYYSFDSRLIYYGKKTRDEYRITRFWANSPFEKENHVGDLIVFIPLGPEDFKVYLLETDIEIEGFIEHFSLSLINNVATYTSEKGQTLELSKTIEDIIKEKATGFNEFPNTEIMSELSREIYSRFHKNKKTNPDKFLLKWIETEYSLFREMERNIYKPFLSEHTENLDQLLTFASSALNRRKSRAGKSLELHANYIFTEFDIIFDNPGKTEGNKKPDFLFPSSQSYGDPEFNTEKLIFLGAKTTCKDRWRQVLNEANRIPSKHLLTLQQGITANQLEEMYDENVTLVVPADYHKYYPQGYRDRLWTLQQFIDYAIEKQNV